MNRVNRQSGFSLIELVIVLFIISSIAVVTVRATISKNAIDKIASDAELTKNEITQIQQASGGYLVDMNEWPDFANNCANAITTLTNAMPTAYLRFINIQSPYLTNYVTSCNTNTFAIEVETDSNDAALILSNQLANAVATATNFVIAEIPRPEEQPTLEQFLLLDGSRAMMGNLDVGGNEISNVTRLTATDVNFNGQDLKLGIGKFVSMGSTAFNTLNAVVNKPNCTQGSLVGTPEIILRIHGVTTILGSPLGIRNVSWSADFNNISTAQWQLSTNGLSAITGLAETYCDYGNWNR